MRCQAAHSDFTQTNANGQSGVTRDQKLRELAAAYDSFTELKGNLEEGTKVCLQLSAVLCDTSLYKTNDSTDKNSFNGP